MRHKSFLFQVDRAYERKLHERCAFANAFCGNKFLETRKWEMLKSGKAKRVLAISGCAAKIRSQRSDVRSQRPDF